MISPSNSSPLLTNADRDAGGLHQPGYFRSAHNDLFQGELSARFAATVLDIAKVATIDDGDPYTSGLAGAMADTFVSLGGEVVLRAEISKGATDMSEALSAIVESGADLVYFPLFAPEAVLLAQQAADYPGLEDTIMMTADAAYSTYFAQNAGEAAIGIYVAAPFVSGDAYDAFVETWKREIDEAGPTGGFHAHGYDAANLLLDAVAAVATERADGTLVIGRGALREALSAVEGYDGLTGRAHLPGHVATRWRLRHRRSAGNISTQRVRGPRRQLAPAHRLDRWHGRGWIAGGTWGLSFTTEGTELIEGTEESRL